MVDPHALQLIGQLLLWGSRAHSLRQCIFKVENVGEAVAVSDRVAVRDGVVEACVKDGLADEAKVHATREVADVLFKVVV